MYVDCNQKSLKCETREYKSHSYIIKILINGKYFYKNLLWKSFANIDTLMTIDLLIC